MSTKHWWTVSAAASTGLLGLTVSSGLVMLAMRFVEEFSHPHELLTAEEMNWAMPRTVVEPSRVYQRPLTIHTIDNTLLRGEFWAQPQPAPTIIVCHGYRVSREHMRPVAAQEYAYGFNVMLFDFRGHGQSDSVFTSGGGVEVHDLEAAITAAALQPESLPGKIVIHGFSMGASVALLLTPRPEIAAIIADSPYASLAQILQRLVNYRLASESSSWKPFLHYLRSTFPYIAWATVSTSTVVFRLRFGHSLIARPATSFKHWHARARKNKAQSNDTVPIMLIHATGDELIPFTHAEQIVTAARKQDVPLETYFVENNMHCGAYGQDPQKYTEVLLNFLTRHLKIDFAQTQSNSA